MPTHGSSNAVSANSLRLARATIAAAKIMDLHLPLGAHAFVLRHHRRLRRHLFPRDPERRPLRPLHLPAATAHRRRYGRVAGRPVAVFPKASRPRTEPASLAWTLLLARGRARLTRRPLDGQRLPRRSTHPFRFRHSGGVVVRYWSAGLSHGAPRKHCRSPPVDDPQLRSHSRRGHSSHLHAAHAGGSALAFSAHLYNGFLVVLGSKSTGGGVDG